MSDQSTPVAFADAGFVQALLADALSHLDRQETCGAERCIRQANMLLTLAPEDRSRMGCLADWQARRASAYIQAHLDDSLRLGVVAALVTRSPSYFARAFRSTFGCSFQQYVIERRVERAGRLMLSTDRSLSMIALDCGLADQAHLTRLFKRLTGETPSQWRRRRRIALLDSEEA